MSKLFQKSTDGGPSPIRREINPEIRILDADEGLVEYVASDETLDSYREVILADGWRFNQRFETNPVFLNSHSMWNIRDVLGRVVSWEVRDGKLIEVVKWAKDVPSNADAILGYQMTEKGYLKAVSVGFLPVAWTHRSDDDFTQIADAAGITGEDRDRVRCIYTEQQQVELSSCPIGANPSALAKGLETGEIAEEFAFNAGIKSTEDFEALQIAGRIIDNEANDSDVKSLARITLLDRVSLRRLPGNFGNSSGIDTPASASSTGSGDAERTRSHKERTEAITEKLKQIEQRIAG